MGGVGWWVGWVGGWGGFVFFTTRVHTNDEDVLRPVIFMSSRCPVLFLEQIDIVAGGPFWICVVLFDLFGPFSASLVFSNLFKPIFFPEGSSTARG